MPHEIKGRAAGLICVAIARPDICAAIQAAHQARPLADVIEIRLDSLTEPAIAPFIQAIAPPRSSPTGPGGKEDSAGSRKKNGSACRGRPSRFSSGSPHCPAFPAGPVGEEQGGGNGLDKRRNGRLSQAVQPDFNDIGKGPGPGARPGWPRRYRPGMATQIRPAARPFISMGHGCLRGKKNKASCKVTTIA